MTVWFFPIVRITEYFGDQGGLLRTLNQSVISLTIHSDSAVKGYLEKGLSWMRHRIENKIHLLDVDAWANAKLQR